MEGDGQLAPGQQRRGHVTGRQRHRVRPGLPARRDGHARLATEAHGTVAAGQQRRAAELQPGMHALDPQRAGAEGVGEAQPRLGAPDGGPQHQPQRLVPQPLRRFRDGEALVRLGRGVAHRIGPLDRGGPARHPGPRAARDRRCRQGGRGGTGAIRARDGRIPGNAALRLRRARGGEKQARRPEGKRATFHPGVLLRRPWVAVWRPVFREARAAATGPAAPRVRPAQSRNTTVRLPLSRMRPSSCQSSARDRTRRSMSRPWRIRSSGVSLWLMRSTSCSMIGPSSRSAVT